MDVEAAGGIRVAHTLAAGSVALLAFALIGSDLWRRSRPPAASDPPELVVDPNHAPFEALLALPRLGPALAERIVAERDRRPFESLEDLDRRVKGLGPATMAALAPHLRIDPPRTPAGNTP